MTEETIREDILTGIEEISDAVKNRMLADEKPDDVGDPDCMEHKEQTTATQKVFQFDSAVALLLQIDNRYAIVRNKRLSWLQVADRTTARVTKRLVMEQAVSTEAAEEFPRRVRLASTDGAGSNIATEDHLEKPGWVSWLILCVIHVLARCHARASDLLSWVREGLLKLVLSLSKSDLMGLFRKAARAVLRTLGKNTYLPNCLGGPPRWLFPSLRRAPTPLFHPDNFPIPTPALEVQKESRA